MATAPERLREHQVYLQDGDLRLRPMTEADWPFLLEWNNDPEVVYYAEGDDVEGRSLEELHHIYRFVSQKALMFMIEVGGRVVGECWLQEMNLERILQRFPGFDCRRIDLTIGAKDLWGRGYGSRTIRLLTRLGFDQGADIIFGLVADYNPRSRRAFGTAGYEVFQVVDVDEPKAKQNYDLVARRETWGHLGQGD